MIGHVDIDLGIRQTESLGAFSLPIPSLVVVSMQVCHARDLGSSPDRVKHKSYTDHPQMINHQARPKLYLQQVHPSVKW